MPKRRDDEPTEKRASHNSEIFGKSGKIGTTELNESPLVKMKAKKLKSGSAYLLIDTGADINTCYVDRRNTW